MTIPTPTLLDRFCRYVRVHTEAVEGAKSYPSSPGQLELVQPDALPLGRPRIRTST